MEDEIKDLTLMKVVAMSNEFETIKVREEENQELAKVLKECWVFDEELPKHNKKGPGDKNIEEGTIIDPPEKILALICGYLTKYDYESFSLHIDSQYVIQNSIRILRCILDIALKKNMCMLVEKTLEWCKFIENRITPYDLPLRHFTRESCMGSFNSMKNRKEVKEGFLETWIVQKLEEKDNLIKMNDLFEMNDDEISFMLSARNSMGKVVRKYLNYFPKLELEKTVKQLAQTILKIEGNLTLYFLK